MDKNNININFPYEFYNNNKESVIVFFPSVRTRKIYPCYSRVKWAGNLGNSDILYLSDPYQELPEYQEAGGSWYIDNQGHSQIENIAKSLSPFLSQYKKILFYGSSMGGYLALNFSKYFKNVSVIAECPQIFLDKYRLAKQLVNRICTPEKKIFLPNTVQSILLENNNNICIYINHWDHHLLSQIQPMVKYLEKSHAISDNSNKIHITQYFDSSYKREHTAFIQEDALPIIKSVLKKNNSNISQYIRTSIIEPKVNIPENNIKVFIWGSCVSRDAFEFVDNSYEVVKFISRQSFATAFDSNIIKAKKFLEKKAKESKEKKYFIKRLESDFLKYAEREILDTNFDVFILELIDERFRIAECKSGLYTYSTTGKMIEYHRIEKIKLYDFDSDIKFELWKQGIKKLFCILKNKKSNIILNKVYWTFNTNTPFSSENLLDIEKNNVFLDRMYNFIESEYKDYITIITYPEEIFEADVNHKWGHAPFHYTLPAYEKFIKSLNKNIENKIKHLDDCERNIAGYYKFTSYDYTYLGQDIDWFKNPFDDRSWQWSLHAFQFFIHHYDKDYNFSEKSIDYIYQTIKKWVEYFEFKDIDNEFPWHDHATALRLDQVIYYYKFLQRNDLLTTEKKKIFDRFVELHCQKLSQEDFYSKHTNHGFDQAISLFQASALWQYQDYKDLALKRFKQELDFAFTSEGVHVENSPGYHKEMINNVLRALNIIQQHTNEENINFDITNFLDNAIEYIFYMMRYDRKLAYIGDTQKYGISLDIDHYHLQLKTYENFTLLKNNQNLSKKDTLPNIKLYEKAGYFIYRSDWSDIENSCHIILKCGYLSPYHRQDDDLNILVTAYGEDWLVDSGLYSHNQKDPVRIYMRSAKAHNVPIFDKIRTIRNFEKIKGKDTYIQEDKAEEHAIACVIAKTHMYENITVRRRLTILDKDHFYCRDILSKKLKDKGYWLFHFPRDKEINISSSHIEVLGKNAQMIIRPKFVEITPDGYKKKVKFNATVSCGWDDKFPSVFSQTPNKKTDTQILIVSSKDFNFSHFDFSFEKI